MRMRQGPGPLPRKTKGEPPNSTIPSGAFSSCREASFGRSASRPPRAALFHSDVFRRSADRSRRSLSESFARIASGFPLVASATRACAGLAGWAAASRLISAMICAISMLSGEGWWLCPVRDNTCPSASIFTRLFPRSVSHFPAVSQFHHRFTAVSFAIVLYPLPLFCIALPSFCILLHFPAVSHFHAVLPPLFSSSMRYRLLSHTTFRPPRLDST